MADIDLSNPAAPRSPRFDDYYFQPGQGIEESRFTFIQGCDLPRNWQDQHQFVIAETGFGTGLNFLLTWQQWRLNHMPGRCLHYLSAEAFPLDHRQLEIALSPWRELKSLAKQLLDQYPPLTPGYHRLVFSDDQVFLTLLIGDATAQLAEMEASVDAWYLDGFTPAHNPDMWSPALFTQIARLSRPGARLATHTTAGPVRRGLQQAGFEISRTTDNVSKRQRLTGHFVGRSVSLLPKWYRQTRSKWSRSSVQATIVGAGLAGASLFKSLSLRSIDTRVVDPGQASASDNPRANVMPRLSLDISLSGRFFWSAFLYATANWRSLPGWHESGTLVLAKDPADQLRLSKLQQCWQLPEAQLRLVDRVEAERLAGLPVGVGGLWFAQSGTLSGQAVLKSWLDPEKIRTGLVDRMVHSEQRWQLYEQSELLAESELLFLANGPGAAALLPHLPLRGFAGQASWLTANKHSERLLCTLINGRYLTTAVNGQHLIGSTFDRWDLSKPFDASATGGQERNLAALESDFPDLGLLASTRESRGWCGIRCSTPDHLPLAGPLVAVDEFASQFGFLRHSENYFDPLEAADNHGLFALLGLGSRAFTSAPLGAELAVSQALGEPWPLERSLALALHPSRFLVRDLKRHKL